MPTSKESLLTLSSLIIIAAGAIGLALGQGMLSLWRMENNLSALLIVILFVALGGAVAVRLFDILWPQPLYAALPGAAIFTSYLVYTALGDQSPFLPRDEVSIVFGIAMFLLFSAGAFLLPLFDSLVREIGPKPNVWLVVIFGFLTVYVSIILTIPNFSLVPAFYAGIAVIGAGLMFTIAQESFGEFTGAWGAAILIFSLLMEGMF